MKIFIAAPFTNHLDKLKGVIDEESKNILVSIENFLKNKGYETFLAHKREEWGLKLMCPDECTYEDYKEMKNSDIVIAIPGNPPSGGVHIELGWASILKKKIIILLEKNKLYSPLIFGLNKISDVAYVEFEEVKDLLEKLDDKLM